MRKRAAKWVAVVATVIAGVAAAVGQTTNTNAAPLEWDRSAPEAPERYIILQGVQSRVYTNEVSVPGTQLWADIPVVAGVTNYLTCVAYDTRYQNPRSDPCNEVTYYVAAPKRPGKPVPVDRVWIRVPLFSK